MAAHIQLTPLPHSGNSGQGISLFKHAYVKIIAIVMD